MASTSEPITTDPLPSSAATKPTVEEIIREDLLKYADAASRLDACDGLERPAYGCTIYLAQTSVETRFGIFEAYIFQDIIHKGYIIALAYGDIKNADLLHTRMHSSCVTSETLRGCDCDCVQQLEGAIQKIAKEGKGVLFYLLQEGRGVGYTAKARDRMLVQASQDSISTFEAYLMLGLKKDYRQYRNVFDICHILSLTAEWVVLTNNPDKVAAMQDNGMKVARSERLEYEPEPFNLAYLQSKAESGHFLERPSLTGVQAVKTPEPVVPLRPIAIQNAQRFYYMARYYLPIRPVENQIVVTIEKLQEMAQGEPIETYLQRKFPLIVHHHFIRNNRVLLKIEHSALMAHAEKHPNDPLNELLTTPYWFVVHVYFDVVSGTDYVVLTYGDAASYDIPVVRIQSESILNRFPVTDIDNKKKYMRALEEIVHYGVGSIVLSYHDGRGAGFGAFAIDRMLQERQETYTSEQSYQRLGVNYDARDYDGLLTVLREHVPSGKIQMVMNSANSLIDKPEYAKSLRDNGIDVVKWIFLNNTEGDV